MYSRKNIRAYQPMTRYLPAESDGGEAAVTPPPDYTGMAFFERKDTADYPETVIPQPEADDPMPASDPLMQEDFPHPQIGEEQGQLSPSVEEESPDTEQPPNGVAPQADEPPRLSPERAHESENALPRPSLDGKEEVPRPSPDAIGGAGEGQPLVTPAWLRSLTLEDLLLFWLILLLLSGEPEDQIYVLLGLLLFAGR